MKQLWLSILFAFSISAARADTLQGEFNRDDTAQNAARALCFDKGFAKSISVMKERYKVYQREDGTTYIAGPTTDIQCSEPLEQSHQKQPWMKITWEPPLKRLDGSEFTNPAKYVVFKNHAGKTLWEATVPARAHSYLFEGIPGETYQFSIRVCDTDDICSESAYSETVQLTP